MTSAITPQHLTDQGLINRLYSEEPQSDREEVLKEVLRREHLEVEYPGSHEDAHDELNG